jgi:branched-chain amino acid transport system permease protein
MTDARSAVMVATTTRHPWGGVVRVGLLGGVVAVYLCLVGIVPTFAERPLISGAISLGHTAIALAAVFSGYLAARRAPAGNVQAVTAGALAGAIAGSALALLVVVGEVVDVRAVMLQASPVLYDLLTFGMGLAGFWIPAVAGAVLGGAAAAVSTLPSSARLPLLSGLVWVVVLGLFAGLLRTPMLTGALSGVARFMFAADGLTPIGAVVTFVVAIGATVLQRRVLIRQRIAKMPAARRRALLAPALVAGLLVVLVLPLSLGGFFSQVVALAALYVLMGFGLNITLGLAGLLDLGFVAFFAVGAYTVGLLTSPGEFGIAQWPFWAAIPFAALIAMAFGAFLGLPILGIRGDYLAIATLGFGEIIRILAGSDLLKQWLGGPRGILNIPKPIDVPPGSLLAGPNQIYYIALACAALVAFVAWRLRGSRLGRAWIAIREDEDVAQALGIDLVQTKLLAYMLGAAFAGLGGGIFSALVGSIVSSSIQLFVSINVVAIIIVGGMGSIPGVVVGAVFLIGVPELFRELSSYRFLFYGIALIAMMRYRPEGLLPSRIVRRELHVPDEVASPGAPANGSVAG